MFIMQEKNTKIYFVYSYLIFIFAKYLKHLFNYLIHLAL